MLFRKAIKGEKDLGSLNAYRLWNSHCRVTGSTNGSKLAKIIINKQIILKRQKETMWGELARTEVNHSEGISEQLEINKGVWEHPCWPPEYQSPSNPNLHQPACTQPIYSTKELQRLLANNSFKPFPKKL